MSHQSSNTNRREDAETATIPPVAETATIPVVAETATVSKRTVETGRALVHKSVEEQDQVIDALLQRQDVEIERVPVGRVVAEPPASRQEGDTWVFPILEEVLVVEKRLLLKEELHIRTAISHQHVQENVRLRRETVTIETQEGNHAMSDQVSTQTMGDAASYDPIQHENQLVAVYDTEAHAEAARDELLRAGIPSSAVRVVQRPEGTSADTVTTGERDEGFWGAIKSIFAPEEDVTAYHHAVDRGHAMVLVTVESGMDRSRAIEILEQTNPIDFDAKLHEWRQSGYDYSQPPARSGMAQSSGAGMQTMGGATAGQTTAATSSAADRTRAVDSPDTIKVIEERLRVGKRDVAAGAVRVRSYVVERPVEEQVRLREERVRLERRPVDREATPEELSGAFGEHTIEARATAEEAVVAKEARVVEEIGIRKEADERTETIRDTVRHTEVDVDDTTGTQRPVPPTNTTPRT